MEKTTKQECISKSDFFFFFFSFPLSFPLYQQSNKPRITPRLRAGFAQAIITNADGIIMHAKARLVPATCNDSIPVQVHVLPPAADPRGPSSAHHSAAWGPQGGLMARAGTVPSAGRLPGVLGCSVGAGLRVMAHSAGFPPTPLQRQRWQEGCNPKPGFSPPTTDLPVWIYPSGAVPSPGLLPAAPRLCCLQFSTL